MGNNLDTVSPRQRGATVVEFAIIAPLLFLLLFGIIEFGRVIATYTGVFTAAREGARYAVAVGDSDAGVPRYRDCVGINGAAISKAVLVNLTHDDIDVRYEGGAGPADCEGGDLPTDDSITSGTQIVVTASSTFESPIPLISTLIGELEIVSEQRRTIYRGIVGE